MEWGDTLVRKWSLDRDNFAWHILQHLSVYHVFWKTGGGRSLWLFEHSVFIFNQPWLCQWNFWLNPLPARRPQRFFKWSLLAFQDLWRFFSLGLQSARGPWQFFCLVPFGGWLTEVLRSSGDYTPLQVLLPWPAAGESIFMILLFGRYVGWRMPVLQQCRMFEKGHLWW